MASSDSKPSDSQDLDNPPTIDDVSQYGWDKTISGDLLIGRRIGEYVVKQRVGTGGMGVVYEGEQPQIGRRVAIKILRGDIAPGQGLLDEARAANQVRHRGIVDIFGFGELPGLGQYLIMEFLEGKPLDQVLHDEAPMRPADVAHLLEEILAPLEAAHARGIVHRDLKPSNVFVVEEPGGGRYVKLLDFGLAKQMRVAGDMAHQTRVTSIVGTPYYMAPEQARSQTVGPKTDLYSVGVIAFEMLTGRVPFKGAQPLDVVHKHVNEPPPPPSQFAPVPPALESLVLQLLEKAPEKRPPSAQALRNNLKRIRRELADAATQLAFAPSSKSAPRPVTTPAPVPTASTAAASAASTPAASTPAREVPGPKISGTGHRAVSPATSPTTSASSVPFQGATTPGIPALFETPRSPLVPAASTPPPPDSTGVDPNADTGRLGGATAEVPALSPQDTQRIDRSASARDAAGDVTRPEVSPLSAVGKSASRGGGWKLALAAVGLVLLGAGVGVVRSLIAAEAEADALARSKAAAALELKPLDLPRTPELQAAPPSPTPVTTAAPVAPAEADAGELSAAAEPRGADAGAIAVSQPVLVAAADLDGGAAEDARPAEAGAVAAAVNEPPDAGADASALAVVADEDAGVAEPQHGETKPASGLAERPRNGTLIVGVRGGRAANVYVNGKAMGATPWRGAIRAGEHTVTLEVDGVTVRQKVRVRSGDEARVLKKWNSEESRFE